MAHKTPLAHWLYINREKFQVQFKELSWPKSYGVDVFDFVTTIKINDQTFEGRGVDTFREIALEKSVSEVIERYICISLGFSSIGFAVSGVIDTKIHAENEFLERYYLDQHLKNKTPLFNLENKLLKDDSIQKFEEKNKLAVEYYIMNTPNNMSGLVCRIRSLDFNKIAFGFSLNQNMESAINKSFLEALPNYAWLDQKSIDSHQNIPWHISEEFTDDLNSLLFDQAHTFEFNFPEPKIKSVDVDCKSLPLLSGINMQTARFVIDEAGIL